MSTGMGGGIIIDRKIHQGATDTGGEVGHFILDPKGPKCPCGLRGCFEAFCGGANIAHFLREELRKNRKSLILEEAGGEVEKVGVRELLSAAKKSDPFALEVWEAYIERLAQGIGIVLQTLDPDAIVLGTIAAKNKEMVMHPLKQALPHYAWEAPLAHCRIKPSIINQEIDQLGPLALAINGLKGVSL